MITRNAKAAALRLQEALGGTDGLEINKSMLALIVELGGSEYVAKQFVTPIQQIVYMFSLLVQQAPTLQLTVSEHPQAPGTAEPVGRRPGEQPEQVPIDPYEHG